MLKAKDILDMSREQRETLALAMVRRGEKLPAFRMRCQECMGAGSFEQQCPTCNGKGHVPDSACVTCKHETAVQCVECKGSRRTLRPCRTCKGERKVSVRLELHPADKYAMRRRAR